MLDRKVDSARSAAGSQSGPESAADAQESHASGVQRRIAVCCSQRWACTVTGRGIAAYDTAGPMQHVASQTPTARCVTASEDGRWLVTAGDDKCVRLWSNSGWTCVRTCTAPKKVSATCFTSRGDRFVYGDKFGDVFAAAVDGEAPPVHLHSHYCAIITALCVDSHDRLLASGDRDGKVKVCVLPPPGEGAWQVVSFCLGHEGSVIATVFLPHASGDVLLSAGLDGRLIAWDAATGGERARLTVASDRGAPRSIVAMCRCGEDTVAVCLEGSDEVALVRLHIGHDAWRLATCTSAPVGAVLLPSDVTCVFGKDGAAVLYAVGGPCAPGSESCHVGCALVTDAQILSEALPPHLQPLDRRRPELDTAQGAASSQLCGELRKELQSKRFRPSGGAATLLA